MKFISYEGDFNHYSLSSPFGTFWRLVPRQNAFALLDQRNVSVPAVLKEHFRRPSGSNSESMKVFLNTLMLLCSSRASHIRDAQGTSFLNRSRLSASSDSFP